MMNERIEHYNTIVVGGGQAGLVTGYHLCQRDRRFVVLDASENIGDAWRTRWDSLRLFTPARLSSLPGMPFPAEKHVFPTKDEMADYLAAYTARFDIPVKPGTRVDHLARDGDRFTLETSSGRYTADNVIVALGSFQIPFVPPFADDLDPGIVQLHTKDYRNPDQLQEGPVLVVGAGNSGAEIAVDVAPDHPVWLSGRHPGNIPFDVEGPLARYLVLPLLLPLLGNYILTTSTPMGRKVRAQMLGRGGPLVRTTPEDFAEAGIKRVPRVAGTQDGLPVLDDGQIVETHNVIWCTGFRPSFDWIDLPIFGGQEHPLEPIHERGVIPDQPGLYFVGLFFQYALSSGVIEGVGRDAAYIVKHLESHRD
jgi:putative flavoprotein involved in K+ transport